MFSRGRQGEVQWHMVGVEIVVAGTILAAAAVAAIITAPGELRSTENGQLVSAATLVLATASLGAYLRTVVVGLQAPFQKSTAERREYTKRAASGVILQAAIVFGTALFITLSF